MFQIRKIKEEDYDKIQEMNYMLGLSLHWNKTFQEDNIFVAADHNDEVCGVGAMSFDGTWYYIDKERQDIPAYRMQLELEIKPGIRMEKEIRHALVDALKDRLRQYKMIYPDKKLCIRCWCEANRNEEMEFWLSNGFGSHNITWILGFDLQKEIPSFQIPPAVTIGIHDFSGDGMTRYLMANELGYDNVQDAEEELQFRLKGEGTCVFTARVGEKVVSSTTVWRIGPNHSATENVFTIPEYHRQSIGRATLCYALSYLKDRGDNLATLTCVGDNLPAIAMYLGLGYQVVGHLVELQYIL